MPDTHCSNQLPVIIKIYFIYALSSQAFEQDNILVKIMYTFL